MATLNDSSEESDALATARKTKCGHLRVDVEGNATFKRLPVDQLVESLQLGIQYSVGGLEARPAHDVLYHDFLAIEVTNFPKTGKTSPKPTPPHRFNDFTISTYAPAAFRHFREKFNIRPEDYLSSICKPFRQLSNPGASGSLFYLTNDDEFIIKTVQKREAVFLRSLLPGYYMNIIQNQRTLLPKFFGLYCYQGDTKNIRIAVMNNLIPSHIEIHEKYDLKGSKYKREASISERQKDHPTWKDLDFMERHPYGLILDSQTYNALEKTVERDCRVLESFQIMDYSFLIGIHYIDEYYESSQDRCKVKVTSFRMLTPKPKRMMYSTPMDNIQVQFSEDNSPNSQLANSGGIPARTADGRRAFLYVGIIDILQSYQLRKKLEHALKSVVIDGTEISVTNPSFYSARFRKFLFNTVFQKKSKGIMKVTPQRTSIEPTSHISSSTPSLHPAIRTPSNYGSMTPSTRTSSSRMQSIRSSQIFEENSMFGSSTTVDDSSQFSDSVYKQVTTVNSLKNLSKLHTINDTNNKTSNHQKRHTPFAEYKNGDFGKIQYVSPNTNGKFPKDSASMSKLPHRNNLSDYSSMHDQEEDDHQSFCITTRL